MSFVVVTGFPHSGTSYMANLVAEMGFNPGPKDHLKGANRMNRKGHWENLKIRNPIWREVFKREPNPFDPNFYHQQPKPIQTKLVQETERYIGEHRIQMYKDTFYPMLHHYLPAPDLVLVVRRDPHDIFESPFRYGMEHARSWPEFQHCHALWWERLYQVRESGQWLDGLIINYEGFPSDETIVEVAEVLHVDPTPELIDRCRNLWSQGKGGRR